jgi:hypothetical protein
MKVARMRTSPKLKDDTMRLFRIDNARTSFEFGVFEGHTPDQALDAMAREAGYTDYAAACAVAPVEDGEILVTEVELPKVTFDNIENGLRNVRFVFTTGEAFVSTDVHGELNEDLDWDSGYEESLDNNERQGLCDRYEVLKPICIAAWENTVRSELAA